jgi:L-lactate dehydrogenase complex protein LldF
LYKRHAPAGKKIAMKMMSLTLSSPTAYHMGGKAGRFVMKYAPFAVNNKLNPWYKQRDMPDPPKESFGEWYAKNRKA